MAHDNNFPTLQDKRLTLVRNQAGRTRKLTNMFNTKLKNKYNHYDRTLEKTRKTYDFKSWQRTIPLKHSLTHIKGTQKFLRKCREQTFIENDEDRTYGIYDGVSLRDMQPEIESIIADSHPAARRMKKSNKLLDDGRRDGRIVDMNAARNSLIAILNRPSYPPKSETMLGLDSETPSPNPSTRPISVNSTPDPISRTGIGILPPIQVTRENTKGAIFRRMRSDTLPSILPTAKKSNTFSFERKLNIRRLSEFRRF